MVESSPNTARTKALVALVVTLVLAMSTWYWLAVATESGLARLEAIDRGVAQCEALWSAARSREDSARVDHTRLHDVIDAQSATALTECADLRAPDGTTRPPVNPREMNGELMPPGLR